MTAPIIMMAVWNVSVYITAVSPPSYKEKLYMKQSVHTDKVKNISVGPMAVYLKPYQEKENIS